LKGKRKIEIERELHGGMKKLKKESDLLEGL